MTYRYYSTQRPVQIGGYPASEHVVSIHNFEDKTYCERIGMKAWGYIDYDEPLTEKEISSYELISSEYKRYYKVQLFVDDETGKVSGFVNGTVVACVKPQSESIHLKNKMKYVEWFDSYEAAENYVNECIEESVSW